MKKNYAININAKEERQMEERLYEYMEITDLKDMLNKSGEKYGEKIAYKIKIEKEKYKTY